MAGIIVRVGVAILGLSSSFVFGIQPDVKSEQLRIFEAYAAHELHHLRCEIQHSSVRIQKNEDRYLLQNDDIPGSSVKVQPVCAEDSSKYPRSPQSITQLKEKLSAIRDRIEILISSLYSSSSGRDES